MTIPFIYLFKGREQERDGRDNEVSGPRLVSWRNGHLAVSNVPDDNGEAMQTVRSIDCSIKLTFAGGVLTARRPILRTHGD